jgi:hypothetical protein
VSRRLSGGVRGASPSSNRAGIGLRYGVQASTEIWVDYPTSEADNQVAATLLHSEVGKFVALSGVPHLEDGVARINEALAKNSEHPAALFLLAMPGHKQSKPRKK